MWASYACFWWRCHVQVCSYNIQPLTHLWGRWKGCRLMGVLPLFLLCLRPHLVLLMSLQECVRRQSPQCQRSSRSSLRLKWGCWMEDEGSTTYFRKNPSRASTNTCLPSSPICVTGESHIPVEGWTIVIVPFCILDSWFCLWSHFTSLIKIFYFK